MQNGVMDLAAGEFALGTTSARLPFENPGIAPTQRWVLNSLVPLSSSTPGARASAKAPLLLRPTAGVVELGVRGAGAATGGMCAGRKNGRQWQSPWLQPFSEMAQRADAALLCVFATDGRFKNSGLDHAAIVEREQAWHGE